MSYRTFQEWVIEEKADIFGFEKKDDEIKHQKDDDLPIDMVNSNEIIDELMRMNIGLKKPTMDFNNQITWGNIDHGEALRLDVSPLGSLRTTIRRFLKDLEGRETWVCKDVLLLPDKRYTHKEINVAHDLFDKLVKIEKTPADSAVRDFDLSKLVSKTSNQIQMKSPCKWMIFDKTKKMNDNHYVLMFNMTGYGQGGSAGSGSDFKINQYHIDLFFDKHRGLIRCWGNGIVSQHKASHWKPDMPDWDEHMAPTQNRDEMIDIIVNSLKSY